jgi:hypothetical protein
MSSWYAPSPSSSGSLPRIKDATKGADGNVIRKLPSGRYRLYSRSIDPKSGKRKNLGTFATLKDAKKHERAVQFFKRRG